jgi:hypothetical protein
LIQNLTEFQFFSIFTLQILLLLPVLLSRHILNVIHLVTALESMTEEQIAIYHSVIHNIIVQENDVRRDPALSRKYGGRTLRPGWL